jgi:hypothetical protein
MCPKEEASEEYNNNNIIMKGDDEQTTPVQSVVSKDDNEANDQPKNETASSVRSRKWKLSSLFLTPNFYPSNQKETIDEESHTDTNDDAGTSPSSCGRRLCQGALKIYLQFEFLILIIIAICLAAAYPPLGADYLQPQITSTWIAVIFIFCKCNDTPHLCCQLIAHVSCVAIF